jgi:D-3-phosphoglycerate dehydrogenase / 2-oxoglutarate reductase
MVHSPSHDGGNSMARFKILTTATAPFDHESEALAGLDAAFVPVPAEEDAVVAAIGDADAFYPTGKVSRRVIEAAKRCRVITLGSIGVDYVDIAAATECGIPVTNAPDTFVEEVADHAMTLLLGGFRRLVEHDRMVRDGRWREGRAHLYQFPRLWGQTLGFVGFGHVARAVALRAKSFGLRMLAYDPYVEEISMLPLGVMPTGLHELLAESNFVSMHAPGTPETGHMLGEKEFSRMKRTALFINTGRGATVDETALVTALQQGWIAGAALDVLEVEPPRQDNPLLQMRNVTFTAHVASASSRFDPARKRRVGQELALVLSGRWPMACVNPSVLAGTKLRRWQPISMERGPNS